MRTVRYVILCLLTMVMLSLPSGAVASTGGEEDKIDVQEIVMGHTGDAHEWHITTIDTIPVSIPLPVIVMSNDGSWHCFMSSAFHHAAGGKHNGFYIPKEGENKDKVCEIVDGKEERVKLDLSLTKNVVQLWIVVILMLLIFIGCARWYRNKKVDSDAPKGFVGLVEMFVMMVNDDVIKACVGEKHYKRYAPYLLTAFFFIFLSNLLGLVPIFPGGANLTGNIAITFVLAMFTFFAINLFGNREYWLEIFWPKVPTWLKCPVPMMPVIELFGILTKPFALMVRLFAN
ncbi:MAG: F0F1 ATP synthase subunit A, partial [Bacteroidaceae bacterium]